MKSGDKTLNVFDFVQLSKNIDKMESRSENKLYLALLEKNSLPLLPIERKQPIYSL